MGPHNDMSDAFSFTLTSIDENSIDFLLGTDRIHSGRTNGKLASTRTIRKVIYNPPATIILWKDGSKTVVKCSEDDIYDPMTGFLLCCLKHFLGADNDPAVFHRFLREWAPWPDAESTEGLNQALTRLHKASADAAESIGEAAARIAEGIARAFRGE